MERKYVKAWRNKIALRKAYGNFTGSASIYMREATGNYPKRGFELLPTGETSNNVYRNLLRKHNLLKNYILSKNIHTPTLYKGLKGENAREFLTSIHLKKLGFLKNAFFHTKTITSTSTNRVQASRFTNRNKKVILVIARGKRPAMIAGHYGINSKSPREKEVTLPPGKFVFKYMNKNTGNYHVNFIPDR